MIDMIIWNGMDSGRTHAAKTGNTVNTGRENRKEGRKEGRKEERKEGRKKGRKKDRR
jgi:hypothetical protein